METTRVPGTDLRALPRPFPAKIENPRGRRGRGPSVFRRPLEEDPPAPNPEPVTLPNWSPAASATQISVPHVFLLLWPNIILETCKILT